MFGVLAIIEILHCRGLYILLITDCHHQASLSLSSSLRSTNMTGHPSLPANVDDELNSREFHGGGSWVEEGVVLPWVPNLLARNMFGNGCGYKIWNIPTMLPPPGRAHTRHEREASPLCLVIQPGRLEPEKNQSKGDVLAKTKFYMLTWSSVMALNLGRYIVHLVSSDCRELVDTGVDEKAFEARHS